MGQGTDKIDEFNALCALLKITVDKDVLALQVFGDLKLVI
jgi:hypothetical protein